MSPKKITDTDKFEIISLYREAGETTASLANRYGVSNSTISRLLKTTIPEVEYEELIQQKRGLKIGIEDEVTAATHQSNALAEPREASIEQSEPSEPEPNSLPSQIASEHQLSLDMVANDVENSPALGDTSEAASLVPAPTIAMETSPMIEENLDQHPRRVRRRSSAPAGDLVQSAAVAAPPSPAGETDQSVAANSPQISVPGFESTDDLDLPTIAAVEISTPARTPVTSKVPRLPVLRNVRPKPDDYFTDLAAADSVETIAEEESEEEDANTEDVSILAAMFGEEIADDSDDEDDEDDEDDSDDQEESSSAYQQLDRGLLTIDRLHVQVKPLSEATLPRTCYIVIDKFAELIVRPLKDFADLGQISGAEIQQRTLPIFDNHRVAKRFSNQRTQRVIKVPDSKVFHKTSNHLRSKGITRLLVDGNIYSLN